MKNDKEGRIVEASPLLSFNDSANSRKKRVQTLNTQESICWTFQPLVLVVKAAEGIKPGYSQQNHYNQILQFWLPK